MQTFWRGGVWLAAALAFWSLGAGARFIPAGIVEAYDVTP